ncbi:integrase [Rhizophagus irregularis DAOM 181602=DAOM 197198]|nr:integrase [Rhizophagus irregularis DAOM 181602=DAOM 197198]
MAAQVPAIFNPNNRFFYDDLLKKCVGTHTKESVNSAILASVLSSPQNPACGLEKRRLTMEAYTSINPIIRHVHEVWCAEDKQLTIYILNWLAFLIQNPDKKPERILGRENFLSTTRLEDVMGRFNVAVRAKKLIILNECDMSGKEWHGANNRLKSLITEPYISIEEKGIDVKRILRSLVKVLENPDTASSFMSYLLSRDLTGFNPRSIPDTQMKRELIEASIPNPQRFIQYYLEMMWPDNCDTLEIPCTNFYSTYQNWCSEKGENKTLSDNKFGMEIKQFAPKMRVSRSGTRINYYILDKAKIVENFSKVIQDVQDVQEAPVEGVELVAEKPAEEKPEKPAEKKPEPAEEKPAPVIRKTPPPLPPKPDHLKERPQELRKEQPDPDEDTNESNTDKSIDNFSDCYLSDEEPDQEEPIPEPDNYDVLDDLLSDSDFTTVNPAPEQQPEYPAESSASVTKPDPEPASEEQFIPEPDTEPEVDRDPEPKEGTRAHWAWQERH